MKKIRESRRGNKKEKSKKSRRRPKITLVKAITNDTSIKEVT